MEEYHCKYPNTLAIFFIVNTIEKHLPPKVSCCKYEDYPNNGEYCVWFIFHFASVGIIKQPDFITTQMSNILKQAA